MRIYQLLMTIFLLLNLNIATAGQVLVLIHGYWSDGSGWRTAGIVSHLQQAGWQDQGHLFPSVALPPTGAAYPSDRHLYTITLPSEAPLPIQAQWLDYFLTGIQKAHTDDEMILVGHSLGGVVARLSMINGQFPIAGLITIASPHLGTDKAEIGKLIADSPLSWVTPLVGLSTINRSRNLYSDVSREYPTTPLFHLNRTPHPKARYISIVRADENNFWTALVPAYSQDMNNVPALHGRALTIPSAGSHYLQPADGIALVNLLASQFPEPETSD
ncbi:MAG: alpha/beta fold hydrolase [Thiotrichaceae bacterium]|nr:alpha/beta fold hydrolase [Thiotrichaceae bacterium]MEC4317340.1 alpha/beta fold hydrolase [Thiotrichaceae bacterium]